MAKSSFKHKICWKEFHTRAAVLQLHVKQMKKHMECLKLKKNKNVLTKDPFSHLWTIVTNFQQIMLCLRYCFNMASIHVTLH
jgi:hypothetical protein